MRWPSDALFSAGGQKIQTSELSLERSITVIRPKVSDLSFVLEIVFRFSHEVSETKISIHDQPEIFNMGFN